MNHAPSSGQFLAIDENSIYHGGGISPLGGKLLRTSRIKSPLSDLNPVPQVYLPDLRPVSFAIVRFRDLANLTYLFFRCFFRLLPAHHQCAIILNGRQVRKMCDLRWIRTNECLEDKANRKNGQIPPAVTDRTQD